MSCSSQKTAGEVKCPKIYKNDFTEILNEKYKTVYENDTITYNEIRFECIYSSFYTHKVMFDKYGKWDKEIYPSNRKHPILMWQNVDLFSNGKKYTIMTNGLEEWKHIYASVMVFDLNETDMLSSTAKEKEAITNLFSGLLKNHKTEKEDFFEIYWKTVDPDHWEMIKKY